MCISGNNKIDSYLSNVTGFGNPTEMSHLAYSTLITQLIAILIHYLCTVTYQA